MKDTELIYALYVQANPVPDPDRLLLAESEAVLLTFEGSPEMLTQEPTRTPDRPSLGRNRRPRLALAAATLLAIVAATVFLVYGGDEGPIAAEEAELVATFDGETCDFNGPLLIEQGTVDFSLINRSTVDFGLTGWLLSIDELEHELARNPIGSDWANEPGDEMVGSRIMTWWASAGESKSPFWRLGPGNYLLHCITGTPAAHVWQLAHFEVVAP